MVISVMATRLANQPKEGILFCCYDYGVVISIDPTMGGLQGVHERGSMKGLRGIHVRASGDTCKGFRGSMKQTYNVSLNIQCFSLSEVCNLNKLIHNRNDVHLIQVSFSCSEVVCTS